MKKFVLILIAIVALVALGLVLSSGSNGSKPQAVGPPQLVIKSAGPRRVGGRVGTAAAPVVGEVFSTSNGAWNNSPITFTYNWQSCNSAGTTCGTAAGASPASSTYTVPNADVNKYIRVQVTATNGSGSATQSSALATSAVPFPTTLAPNEVDATNRTAASYGWHRQGGCSEINLVTDSVGGTMLQFQTADSDHWLPGTNVGKWTDGVSYPTGGCYAVHRNGNGVAATLYGNASLTAQTTYYAAFDLMIHSSQPGLSSGTFPTTGVSSATKWFNVWETLGGVSSTPAMAVSMSNNTHQSGSPLELVLGYQGRDYSLWGPPFQFDIIHHIIIKWVISPCGTTNGGSYSGPTAPVACTGTTAPSGCPCVTGHMEITDNGVPFKANFGAGSAFSDGPTETTLAPQTAYLFQYRSTGALEDTPVDGSGPKAWGGTLTTLASGERVGTTQASVQ